MASDETLDVCEQNDAAQDTEKPTLSKNQQKKLKRLQNKLEWRKGARAMEKARKKERRQKLKEMGLGETLRKKTYNKMADSGCKMNIVVDMAFEKLMNENLIRNTIAQLAFCYSANRRSANPSQYHIAGMTGQTKELFNQVEGTHAWDVHIHESALENVEQLPASRIVYLSSDSENTLDGLNEDDVYVIGGLLDHNQHPGVSHQRAVEHNWRHAKLPIGDFIKMNSRKVLTINHVFEILLHYYESRNWEEAFFKVIPKRKGAQKANTEPESGARDDKGDCDGNQPEASSLSDEK